MLIAIQVINLIFQVYTLMLFAKIISSWVPQLNDYRIMQFVSYYTDPYLAFFRRFIPPLGMIDLSPIVAFISLNILQNVAVHLVVGLVA
ncbi:MAG: YggT family protein [Parachlamydiaceae bacterium]|nr:YggT family protein [Parachlamydiaceae bacterium]